MTKVRDFAKTTLNDLIGDATFWVYRYPEEDRDVADELRLSLVILSLHQGTTGEGLPPATEQFVTYYTSPLLTPSETPL